mgnify:CR=1 FL=1
MILYWPLLTLFVCECMADIRTPRTGLQYAWRVWVWRIAFGPSFKDPAWTSRDAVWSGVWIPVQ